MPEIQGVSGSGAAQALSQQNTKRPTVELGNNSINGQTSVAAPNKEMDELSLVVDEVNEVNEVNLGIDLAASQSNLLYVAGEQEFTSSEVSIISDQVISEIASGNYTVPTSQSIDGQSQTLTVTTLGSLFSQYVGALCTLAETAMTDNDSVQLLQKNSTSINSSALEASENETIAIEEAEAKKEEEANSSILVSSILGFLTSAVDMLINVVTCIGEVATGNFVGAAGSFVSILNDEVMCFGNIATAINPEWAKDPTSVAMFMIRDGVGSIVTGIVYSATGGDEEATKTASSVWSSVFTAATVFSINLTKALKSINSAQKVIANAASDVSGAAAKSVKTAKLEIGLSTFSAVDGGLRCGAMIASGCLASNGSTASEYLSTYSSGGLLGVGIYGIFDASNLDESTTGKIFQGLLSGLAGGIQDGVYTAKVVGMSATEKLALLGSLQNGVKKFANSAQKLSASMQLSHISTNFGTSAQESITTKYDADVSEAKSRYEYQTTSLDQVNKASTNSLDAAFSKLQTTLRNIEHLSLHT